MVAIDEAGVEDVDELADRWVDLAAGQRAYGSHLAARGNRSAIRDSMARHVVTGGLLVARDDGDVVGFVMFQREHEGFEQDVTRGVVENLYVVPDRRGEGIGGDLLAAAERRLADVGVDVVSLQAMAANSAALRFYEREGYHPHRVELEKRVESDTHSKED